MNRLITIPAGISLVAFAAWCLLAPGALGRREIPGTADNRPDAKRMSQVNAQGFKPSAETRLNLTDSKKTLLPSSPGDVGDTPAIASNDKNVTDRQQVIEAATQSLIAKWDAASIRSQVAYGFSRRAIPDEKPLVKHFASLDFSEHQLIRDVHSGTFVVTEGTESLRFPVLVDQGNLKATVYAKQRWHDFDDWVDHRMGVFN